jgi:hypothetical protein
MLRFLLDEHLRGPLWVAIVRHNVHGGLLIDGARGGDAPDLPLGSDDATILQWAERESRILLTEQDTLTTSRLGSAFLGTYYHPLRLRSALGGDFTRQANAAGENG